MNEKELLKKIRSLEDLLSSSSTTSEKFDSVRTFAKGIDKRIDKQTEKISTLLKGVEQLQEKKIIELSVESLPEKTKKQKRRKKALLLLLSRWKLLEQEVRRVKTEIVNIQTAQTKADKLASGSKIVAFAKGPFGIITLIAAVIVGGLLYLNSKSVEVIIKNEGCRTIMPAISKNINLPGLKLPTNPIPSGGQSTAVVPPLKVSVDGTQNPIVVKAYGASFQFQLPGDGIQVSFDSKPLIGNQTEINLASPKVHEVIVSCD